jgi:hypothetical protein
MAKLALNFNAMIDHLYKLVDSEGIKNIYTDKPAIRFLEKKSFAGKIYQQTHQDEVRHCTSGLQQKERYEARLEERIGSLQRGTRCIEMLSPKKKPFVCSSSCL